MIPIKKALNKAFLKQKPIRNDIDKFKKNLINMLDSINESESEENQKNFISDFLKKTYFEPDYHINTKGRNDLVIHNGKKSSDSVGVIIESKSISNKTEMISRKSLNKKALQELVLYFLRERITENNHNIKNLIATNLFEWFIFDAYIFEKAFAQNSKLKKDFQDFEQGRLSAKNTDFFYKEIAAKYIDENLEKLEYCYFDIRDIENEVRDNSLETDKNLIAYYKILSPEHLLKLPFQNDSNTLNQNFYRELLHIIGLEEVKEGSKKLINRKKKGYRNYGSFLEMTIFLLDEEDYIRKYKNRKDYGETRDEQIFGIALELSITWINRVLFLKLLESQLVSYNKGNREFRFLDIKSVPSFDQLNSLFFNVLAKKENDRHPKYASKFAHVPYLNSSLFDKTKLEEHIIVTNLDNDENLPIYSTTALKDNEGKKITGDLDTLEYLFKFLDAYDFSSEGGEEIQEENKTIINASVLGLIFEKINGYKDGSFFTPGFITMYMCRETIRRAVVQKFNEEFNWKIKEFNDLKEDLSEWIKDGKRSERRLKANSIINSLKICDPAVGSGHILVSALNEIISIKHDLRILSDENGNILDIELKIENDELIITDSKDNPFAYNPESEESQTIQQTLFHEKQTIIENCLFGVDINPNSVKICRLRLWIELLKNAYYKNTPSFGHPSLKRGEGSERKSVLVNESFELATSPSSQEGVPERRGSSIRSLETLPNIDINIKTGNSLISRFPLDVSIADVFKKASKSPSKNQKKAPPRPSPKGEGEVLPLQGEDLGGGSANLTKIWDIEQYLWAVNTYKNATDKAEKEQMTNLIAQIKDNFRSEVTKNDPKRLRLKKKVDELQALQTQTTAFERTKKEEKEFNKKVKKIADDITKLEAAIADIESNAIYNNAFEWRFEFPEVLDSEGNFKGFDVVIGNPPWGAPINDKNKETHDDIIVRIVDSFMFFTNLTTFIMKTNGIVGFIIPDVILYQKDNLLLRRKILKEYQLIETINLGDQIFTDVARPSCIILFDKNKNNKTQLLDVTQKKDKSIKKGEFIKVETKLFEALPNEIIATKNLEHYNILLKDKLTQLINVLDEDGIQRGVSPDLKEAFILNKDYVSEKSLEENYIKLTSTGGRDTQKYITKDNSKRLIYTSKFDNEENIPNIIKHIEGYKNKITCKEVVQGKHPFWSLHRTRNKDIFEKNEKILGVITGDRIIVSLDKLKSYPTDGLYILNSNLANMNRYLIGLLNSKIATFLYRLLSLEEKRTLAQIKPTILKQLPIPKNPTPEQQAPIIELVDKILEAKKANPEADTTAWEAEIDQHVYKLYNLSEEEIKIVEGE